MDDFEQFLKGWDRANVIPVVGKMPADLLTPLAVYLKLAAGRPNAFLLESVEGGENLARYSFIGAGADTLLQADGPDTRIRSGAKESTEQIRLWEYLKRHFEGLHLADERDFPSFTGGAMGYFGFDCFSWFEPAVPAVAADGPAAEVMLFRSIVAFDHVRQSINLVTLVFRDEVEEAGPRSAYEQAVLKNNEIRRTLDEPFFNLPAPQPALSDPDVRSNWDRHDFEEAVQTVKDSILAGDCYQAVLSQRFTRDTNASSIEIYRALRSLNPSPYMFLLQFEDKAVIGASPEMLVRARGQDLEYRPIAGTRPRMGSQEEDDRMADEMRADPKEVAEHQMLVDLGRNDLGRVSKYGSVTVEKLMTVEKYSHVQHLVSSLKAVLREGSDRFDAFAACFPAGTVSGAPKVSAIRLINELEPTSRGVYAGAVGYFDYSGNMDTCIAIRTLVLSDGTATVQAGAGIVADSVPELEFEETVNKAKALLTAIDIAEGRRR